MLEPEQHAEEELVGIVTSESESMRCYVVLLRSKEKDLPEDTIGYIKLDDDVLLGILRSGKGMDRNISPHEGPGPIIASLDQQIPDSRRFVLYRFDAIGRRRGDGGEVEVNRFVIPPGSRVYRCRRNPFEGYPGCVPFARYWEEPWPVPFKVESIPRHILVVGSTGSGKSFLTRFALVPLFRKAGYSVIIFDWHGCDYAPFYPESVVKIEDVALDAEVVASYINEVAKNFGYRTGKSDVYEKLVNVLEGSEEWRGKPPAELKAWILEGLKDEFGDRWEKRERDAVRGLERMKERHWKHISGIVLPKEVVEMAKARGLVVLDMSGTTDDEKLSVFVSIASAAKEMMSEAKAGLSLSMVIDEAPQYAPSRTERTGDGGLQAQAKEVIRYLVANGRKYNVSLTLIAQGLAGDIGIDAAIRRNLNTHFIGRIMPQDYEEAERFLGEQINLRSLLYLKPGQFYFEGLGNPFPTPLLISFDIEDKKAV